MSAHRLLMSRCPTLHSNSNHKFARSAVDRASDLKKPGSSDREPRAHGRMVAVGHAGQPVFVRTLSALRSCARRTRRHRARYGRPSAEAERWRPTQCVSWVGMGTAGGELPAELVADINVSDTWETCDHTT